MTMNLKSIVAATEQVPDDTTVIFLKNNSRDTITYISSVGHAFRGNRSKVAFDASESAGMTAYDLRETMLNSLEDEFEWSGNLGRVPASTISEETEVAITEFYRDSYGEILTYFYNEAEDTLIFFITDEP